MARQAVARFDAESYTELLETTVIPGILQGVRPKDAKFLPLVKTYGRTSASERQHALLDAAKPFAPPPQFEGGGEANRVLIGMIALRAATTDYLRLYPQARVRHKRAASWVCENFAEIMWW